MEAIVERVQSQLHDIDIFRDYTVRFFETHPDLTQSPQVVHSVKSRIKDLQHVREKIQRKSSTEDPITPENIFDRVTDLAGVRVLHLYQAQFTQIHHAVTQKLDSQDWILYEEPKAYTWDPESRGFFENQGLNVEVKESLYTSVHYVIKPREDSPVSCEIQVRTLFEEVWGEIDHLVNYPEPTDNITCREQIGVLARLVGAGSRLADSICRAYTDEESE
ncbi:RelA/SpoT domain-containing protein [Candidatus Poribacteria bacterium]|nr:RelA/SpoT domain-containing protein [Candidatus Poribacteria bacterium]MYG08923.1 RelA/SpoT domain-containing protein [Candidatus Poribacteria bacterium]MYK23659.1 RelA/SpoT domain-containing protein [Candidatus Poribacteria bacterium]